MDPAETDTQAGGPDGRGGPLTNRSLEVLLVHGAPARDLQRLRPVVELRFRKRPQVSSGRGRPPPPALLPAAMGKVKIQTVGESSWLEARPTKKDA